MRHTAVQSSPPPAPAFEEGHLAAGVIPEKVNRQNELQPGSFCNHGSLVTQPANTAMKSTIMVFLKLQAL